MTQSSHLERESRRLKRVAKEYRDKGFHVTLNPGPSELPMFLSNFRPDMIATSAEKNIVVEVKSEESLSGSEYLVSLAKSIESHPGWEFELVVTNPRDRGLEPHDALPLSKSQIRQRVQSAKKLVGAKEYEPALLVLWSAIEAAMRRLADREHIVIEHGGPKYLLKQLYSLGYMSRSQYRRLQKAISLRNTIVHGLQTDPVNERIVGSFLEFPELFLKAADSA